MSLFHSQKVEFTSPNGIKLAARLELPAGPAKAFGLFAHCFTCSKDVAAATRISRSLAAQGIAVLRFDFTGLGNSDGDFANTNFSSNISDLVSAAEYLASSYEAPKLLVGHSLGGAAVLMAAAKLPSVEAVATIGAPYEPAHVTHLFAESQDQLHQQGEAEVTIGLRQFKIKQQFVQDLESYFAETQIKRLGKALLIFHSPQDTIVGIDNAAHIYQAAMHPKSFVSLDGADHLLSNRSDGDYVGQVLASWAGRYVTANETGPDVEDHTVKVESFGRKLTHIVNTAKHQVLADEPKELGGDDLGPNPYEFLLAGLGACTSMTLKMYARHKKWPLEDIQVTLKHDRIHAEDCDDCESKSGKIDVIDRKITVVGKLADDQRKRLLEIADKCPVHRTLHNEIKVRSQLI